LSQKATWVTYTVGRSNQNLARLLTAPLHPFVSVLDEPLTRWANWPPYSFCVEATKPRFVSRSDASAKPTNSVIANDHR
jgi:hypothetical protein